MKKIISFIILVTLTSVTFSQIIVNNTANTPFQLVNNVLTGTGLTVSNVTFNGSAILANNVQTMVGTFNSNGSGFPLANGIIMGSGNVQVAVGPNNSGSATNNTGVAPDPNDPDLNAISTAIMNNECILEFDFIPQGTQISFNYIFASEEYPEWVFAGFNDAFGFFLSGPGIAGPYTNGAVNVAQVPGAGVPVTIDNVNATTNAAFYVNNAGGQAIQYDGHTTVLQASAQVQCGQTYHIKLAIGDAGDTSWDSGMFLQAFVSNPVDVNIVSNEGCLGDNDGAITTTVNTGTPPFNFILNGPVSGSNSTGNFNNLAPGLYTLTVSDANNCPVNVDFNIAPGIPCCSVTATGNDPSCNGGSDGTATATPAGGQAPYSYAWSNGQTTQTATGLTAGTYTVNITDANGCTSSTSVTLSEPTAVTSTTTPTNVSCFGGTDGQIVVNANGGTPSYTYSLNGGSFQGGSTFNGLIAGNYTVAVKDNNGCTITLTQAITEPTNLTLSETNNVSATCGMANGQTTISANGGTGGYSYDLGGTTNGTGIFTGLTPGNYNITVTDGNGCTENINISIGNSAGPVPSVDASNAVACAGGFNGSVTVAVSGGTSPYTYSLDGGTAQASNTFTLAAGAHTVTVTDFNGCTGDVTFNITEPSPLVYNTTLTPTTCNGDCDGQIAINASGSNGGYTYSVDGGPFLGASTITGLCAGNHNVVVQDVNGCSSNSIEIISEPAPVSATFTFIEPSCYGVCDAEIHFTNPIGGDGNYTYSVDNGTTSQASPDFLNQCDGSFNIIIEDGNGCQYISNETVTTPPQITFTTNFNNPSNCGSNDGAFSMVASNGTPNYNYYIHNSDYSLISPTQTNNGAFPNLYSGLYTIVVTDNNGCMDSSFVALQDQQMSSTLQFSQDLTCYHSDDGVGIVTIVSGGAGAASFVLNTFSTGGQVGPQANGTFGGLPAGDHTITITSGPCTNIIQFTLTEPDTIQFDAVANDVSCPSNATNIANDGTITFSNAVGGDNSTYEYSIDGGITYQASPNFNSLAAGTYTLFVRDPNGCEGQSTIDINQPTDFSVTTSITDLTCNGDNTGFMQVFANGGSPNYTFDLNGTSNATGIFSGLAANPNYNITITDNATCTFSATAAVDEPPVLTATYAVTDANCYGVCDGEILVNASGGTPNYLYSADNGVTYQSGNNLTGLCAGNHQIRVKDDHDCVVDATQTVNEPTEITFNMTSTPATCGNDNATVTINASNGTPNYQYSASSDNGLTFTPLQAGNIITNLPAANTIVMVTDFNSCEVSQTINLIADPEPVVNLVIPTNPLCNGDNNGAIDITAANGVTPYQYSIDNGTTFQNGNVFNNLIAGNYQVVVQDANGCLDNFPPIDLTQPDALQLVINKTDVLCYGDFTGEIDATITGGTSPYLFSIDGGVTTQAGGLFSYIGAGNYTVDIVDGNNCTTSQNATINEPLAPLQLSLTTTLPTCFGDCDATISTTVTGGTTPYSYNWSALLGNTDQPVIDDACSGNYSLIVTDANGCTDDSLNFDIFDPTPIIFDLVTTNVSCHPNNGNNNDGVIDIVIPNQTTPLSQFSFEGGPLQAVTQYTNLSPGLYTVYGENDNGCSTYYTTNVYQPDELISGVPNDTLVCNGSDLLIVADSAIGGTVPYTYQWSSNGSTLITDDTLNISINSDTTLVLTVLDSNNCTVNYTQLITIPPTLIATASNDDTICPGTSTDLTSMASGGTPNYTYQWLNTNINSENISVTPTLTPSEYVVQVTDACNEIATDTVLVYLYDDPTPTVIGGAAGCSPYEAHLLNAGNVVQNGGNVIWSMGDGTIISGQDSVLYTYDNEGCYDISISVTTVNGCTSDSTYADLICVNPIPTAEFDYAPALPTTSSQLVQFNNLSEGASTYMWDFDSIYMTHVENPEFEFNATEQTTFNICLTAISEFGCSDTICHPITVYDELVFYVPNAFTPDNDNFNETFKPVFTSGFDPNDYHLTIFNRWGEIVFESYNAQVGWNGKYAGEMCEDGVYVWQISFGEIISDEKQLIRGHVTLLK